MANHVTKFERLHLRVAALELVQIDDYGQIIRPTQTVTRLAAQENVSIQRARAAVAYAARRMRSPDYQAPAIGRPSVMEDGQSVTIYLPGSLIDAATKLGSGNLSEGVRIALAAWFDAAM